ncbi:MAG TPA: hypothetical protein VLG91_06490, partial [Streptomyces sp.]|nr:hypothetical protein [Streptomyces sp.]
MGILSLLRNAFSRSRKGRDTVPSQEAERVSSPESTDGSASAEPRVPAQAAEPTTTTTEPAAPTPPISVADDLVSAAFDNVTVPKPRGDESGTPTEAG